MSRRGWVLFAAMSAIWGIPYLLIRVAVRDLDPGMLVFARTAIGALVLVPVAVARDELRPVLPRWRIIVVYTVVELAVPWLLLSDAERRLTSSLSGLIVAAVPLVVAAMVVVHRRTAGTRRTAGARRTAGTRRTAGARRRNTTVAAAPATLTVSGPATDRMGAAALAGLVIGLAGVGAVLGLDQHGGDARSLAELGVVVVGYALGPMIAARRLADLPSLGVVATSLALCALGYLPVAATEIPRRAPSATALASVVVLGVVCTAVAFVLFFALIAETGPTRATLITYVNPAVAVVLGVAFLGEGFGAGAGIGFVLILAGCWLATRHARAPALSWPAAMRLRRRPTTR
ncbi:MAG TPA: DMT family transporter [Acidimicrobiales bacterium]|nr:DMT family transporter [Acidimicrobiales bacterium]